MRDATATTLETAVPRVVLVGVDPGPAAAIRDALAGVAEVVGGGAFAAGVAAADGARAVVLGPGFTHLLADVWGAKLDAVCCDDDPALAARLVAESLGLGPGRAA